MKKRLKRNISLPSPQVESDMAEPNLVVLISQIQQQLSFLEKKIDTLISQSSERPSRNFDRPYRNDRGGRGDNFRERSFTKAICADCNQECEVPFKPTGGRPVYCKECFSKRKDTGFSSQGKYENRQKETDFSQGPHFSKRQGDDSRRPRGRKKPAFRRRSR